MSHFTNLSCTSHIDHCFCSMNTAGQQTCCHCGISRYTYEGQVKPEAAALLPEPLEVYMETEDGRLRDAAYLRIVAEKVRSKVGVIMTWEIPSVVAQTLEGIAKRIEASACAAQTPEPPDMEMMAVAMTEWARLIRLAEDQQTLLAIADDIDLNATSLASPKTPLLADDDFSDAVMRVGYQAQADALAPKHQPEACIACGERNDGGYMVEDGPGPFCSQCWQLLERNFTP